MATLSNSSSAYAATPGGDSGSAGRLYGNGGSTGRFGSADHAGYWH
ncbi:hypothetical protein [Mycobacterium sp. TY814]|nr:hypothetical protein [Mycobacterium sp. TY814]MDP7726329.1 hypothetical protein [Mycobacterium sp. TY814]